MANAAQNANYFTKGYQDGVGGFYSIVETIRELRGKEIADSYHAGFKAGCLERMQKHEPTFQQVADSEIRFIG